jgi:hypothetical protein
MERALSIPSWPASNGPVYSTKARALAREILNDWDAITAFVTNPRLNPRSNASQKKLCRSGNHKSFWLKCVDLNHFIDVIMDVMDVMDAPYVCAKTHGFVFHASA